MKITFLSDDFPPESFGGAGISTFELAMGMKRAGHEVLVITTCRKESEAGEAEYERLRILKIASDYPERWRMYRSLYNPPVLKRLKEILDVEQPDIVHANNIHYHLSWHSLLIAKRYAKGVVWTARDTLAFYYGKLDTEKYLKNLDPQITWIDNLNVAGKRWNPLYNLVVKRNLSLIDRRLAVSLALSEALEKNGIKNVEVMHTGARISDWEASREEVELFKNKHGLEGKKVVFAGGRLSGAKGLEKVTEAIKKIPKAELLTAGTHGSWFSREEMRIAYAASDVVVVPSLYLDPFPRQAIEASASGRAIVATLYGGAKEIVENNHSGFVVNPFDVDAMAEKINELLTNPEKAESFGQAARKSIETDFNLDDKVRQHLNIYEALL